ncbi:MAG: 50S ribosomal protein L25/general stress protein Ctc [Burkholderiales bacterium]
MKFVAFERAKQGTGASRRLRNTGKTPGIVYGGTGKPELIELDHNALWHALKKEAFHSSILDMEVAGKVNKVLLRDVQMHPFKQLVLHVDFQRVLAKEKIHVEVPFHYTGEENSPAVKLAKCLINHIMTELEVSCLPADLPEHIEVDLSKLEKGDTIHLSAITLPQGVTALLHGQEDPVIVSVVNPLVDASLEEEAETTAATVAEEHAEEAAEEAKEAEAEAEEKEESKDDEKK